MPPSPGCSRRTGFTHPHSVVVGSRSAVSVPRCAHTEMSSRGWPPTESTHGVDVVNANEDDGKYPSKAIVMVVAFWVGAAIFTEHLLYPLVVHLFHKI